MSKYTTEVRFICESKAGMDESKGFDDIQDILDLSYDKIFDFDYPIFDNSYKPILEKKILKYYYTREICAETVGLWKHFLDVRMNEIMPYYNKLYESELLEFNPLHDADYTRTIEKEGEETGTESGTNSRTETATMSGTVGDSGTKNSTRTDNLSQHSTDGGSDSVSGSKADKNNRWDYFSDTPQGTVGDLTDLRYLTNARHIVDDGTGSTSSGTTTYGKTNNTTNTGTVGVAETDANTRTYNTSNGTTGSGTNSNSKTLNTTQDYVEHVVGKMPGVSFARTIVEYRNSLLNIDKMIIDELADLFFTLW